jgi:cytochrome c oxidase subunit 2
MWFYVRGLTSRQRSPSGIRITFYGWIGFLVAVAISFHLLTAWKLPWVHWEFRQDEIKPDREILVGIKRNQFRLPDEGIRIKEGEIVRFTVLSEDLTYGFGVFRGNGTMVFQMQVVPGHSNEIIWLFFEPGKYSIRCTEYAGINTWKMALRNSIEVSPDWKLAKDKAGKSTQRRL